MYTYVFLRISCLSMSSRTGVDYTDNNRARHSAYAHRLPGYNSSIRARYSAYAHRLPGYNSSIRARYSAYAHWVARL